MRIRTQILLMATAVMVPVILAAGIALDKIMEGEKQAALRGLKETVRATALIVDREVQGSMWALKALGNSPSLENRDFKAFYNQAAALNQMPDVWTLLLDETGTQILNTVRPLGTPPPAPLSGGKVAQVVATQKPVVTDLVVGPATGKLVTSVYVPAAAAGGKSYVVAQAFSVEHWKKTALQASMPSDWIVAVIDRNGKFISRSHGSDEFLGRSAKPELVAAAAAADQGLIRHFTVEGVDSYDAFAHSSLTGWTIAVAAPVKSIELAAQRAVQVAVTGILLAVGVALIIAAAFGRHLIKAIEGAGSAAGALGRGERPLAVQTGIAEVNDLNRALVNTGALLDVERQSRQAAEAERQRLLENETLAREAAQAQNMAKDQFLAMLGHELRNPLAAISGASALLERGGLGKDGAERYLEIITRQNRHLGRIVNDLLDVSRLMAGKIELDRQPFNLADCLNDCVDALRTTERAEGYVILVHASPVWVDGDVSRMEQILNNLMTNALKFSPFGGEIEVTVCEEAGRAVVTVRDRGAGMTPELLSRVFEPFVQGPPPVNRAQSGLGIGLALVRQLVELHGGEVEASSAGADRGSLFSFWVPSISAPGVTETAANIAAPQRRKLVYVEDNPDARTTMGQLLEMFGYEVFSAQDGAGALSMVLAVKPDAVILDIGLPDMDGYEVARRLRDNPESRQIPLIALTGYGQVRDKEIASLAGFNTHLVKPVDPDDLARAIEAVLKPQTDSPPG
ncbi:MAG TPA: ATP-binding protein [Polaromonas sp.]|uniref:hybrid sensor histidine kinase/response regulator n=1 Tax=Polaromonas sp. TaxID=1869339 RepID=UPI002D3FD263|nr:ATP-binding protein [Polaromonas sp.]HYW57852.1 ATP-binding protein [Polaromonas sp.]